MTEGDKYIMLGKFLNLPKRYQRIILVTMDAMIKDKER